MSKDSEKTQAANDVTRGIRDAATLAAELSMSAHALPAGTRLQDFVITGLLGEGGFGIVYLAEDTALQREVALKEYLPSSMASRAKDAVTVLVKSHNHQETFAMGLKSFVNEARLLARFDHSALVKVHRFWEANGTAYMVMPYYRGPTLKATLAAMDHLPGEAELRPWLWPLMDALTVMHAAHCYHRDIAPDNILITENGPLLLDFGAARRVIGDMTHALTVVLKPGFAPIEQYGEVPGMGTGPWTDIYALASVLYAAITGKRPMPSVERILDDRLRPLKEVAAGRLPDHFLRAIDGALAIRPDGRPQTVEAFRALLEGRGPATAFPAIGTGIAPNATPARASASAATPAIGAEAVATSVAASGAAQRPRHALTLGLGGIGLLVVAGAGYWISGRPDPAPVVTPAPAPLSVPQAGRSPALAPAPAPAVPDLAPAPAPAPAASTATLVPVPRPFQPSAAGAMPAPSVPVLAPTAPLENRPALKKPPNAPPAKATASPQAAKSVDMRAKCSDILQKASLEALTPSEQAFLRKECR